MTAARTVVLWAFICRPQHGSEGGLGWNWAHAYARRGDDVHLVTMPTFRAELEERLAAQPGGGKVTVHFTKADDDVYRRGHQGRLRFKLDYLQWQEEALRVSRRDGLDAADMGHHVSLGSMLLGTRLDQLGPPFVFGSVGGGHLAGHELGRYLGWSPRETARTITVKHFASMLPKARRTASRADLLLAGNAGTEALARRLGARHVERMLSEGIDESLLAPAVGREQRSREQIVLWVGRFLPIKGAPLAVEAFEHVRRAAPTARLVMVGEGGKLAATQRRARELGLADAVEFTGKLDWPSVMRLYDEADVLLQTSIRDTSSATAMEAAARGLPVVALRHSGGGACDDYPEVGATKVSAAPVASVAPRLGQALTEVLFDDDYQWRSKVIFGYAVENTWDAKVSRLSRWQEVGRSQVTC